MRDKAPIFEKIYHDYLAQITRLDIKDISQKTGLEQTGKGLIVPLFGKSYRISGKEILDPHGNVPLHSVSVVLSQYLLQYPATPPEDNTWVSYKDFRNAAPLVNTFHLHSEMEIAKTYSGRVKALKAACLYIGGHDHTGELNYDLHVKFYALPGIPMCLLFNDADNEFPAQCLLLFERRAEQYLDMECLAILGWILTEALKAGGVCKK